MRSPPSSRHAWLRAADTELERRQKLQLQLHLEFTEAERDQRLQYEADARHMAARLDGIAAEIETEPAQIGDLIVGAFFENETDKARERERLRRQDLVLAWLQSDEGAPPPELIDLRDRIRVRLPVFHWMAELPEVFWDLRPDPLDQDKVGEKAWMDAFVGNPPFMGGRQISGDLGVSYLDWLQTAHNASHGNADYSAHFFRRMNDLLGEHGTIGLIATNTIAQGDTRATGLQRLLHEGLVIRDATRSLPWPGDAAVTVAVVHLEKGRLTVTPSSCFLDGIEVTSINSRLRAGDERPDARALRANARLSFKGRSSWAWVSFLPRKSVMPL